MKLSIYVPDERADDIERWRERLNFSKVFIEAFDQALAADAAISNVKGKEMKAVVERLTKEADGTFEYSWKVGAKLGRVWATRHAHLSDLRNIAEGVVTFNDRKDDVRLVLWGDYQHCGYYQTPEEDYEDAQMAQSGTDIETYRRGYNQGFVDAVKQVWDDIKTAF
ncbi:MAG: hypothetical protein IAF94_07150 [Pirellulaceae bacterium]|nr:hypothetical protein [Pirellulaceae bacterium]